MVSDRLVLQYENESHHWIIQLDNFFGLVTCCASIKIYQLIQVKLMFIVIVNVAYINVQ